MQGRLLLWVCAGAVAGTAHLFASAVVSGQQAPVTASAPHALAAAQEPRVIEVTARKFEFEPARIEVTVGERVRLVVKSDDGVHGIAIKKFKINKLVPRGGTPVTVEFVAAAPGTFPILCSENCGEGHEDMRGTLVVRAKQ